MLYGAIIEGVATLLCRLTTRYLGDLEPKYASAIDSFVATALVVAAFDYSGGSDEFGYSTTQNQAEPGFSKLLSYSNFPLFKFHQIKCHQIGPLKIKQQ